MPSQESQLALWRANPVQCVHCREVVAELPADQDHLLALMQAHQCGTPERWAA
jgi:hypothetical protein